MPRGIPNAKRDETGMKYTTFHVPLAPNPKYSSSTYLKSDANTLWYRNARNAKPTVNGHTPEQRRGQQTLVIHPGSANFRIGRATDLAPVVVPAIVARKTSAPAPPLRARNRVRQPADPDEPPSPDSSDPTLRELAAMQSILDGYMSYLGLHRDPDGLQKAREASANRKATLLPPAEDTWISECDRPYLIGDEVYWLADPSAMGYIVRRPIHGQNFAAADYTSLQAVLNDIEVIIRETLRSSFEILPRDYHNHSVVLVIPDFYETSYVREFVHLLLVQMGFKQICVQQESLAATYGAGASTACVVNFGAAKTSIACVDEGIIIPDTRIVLDIGGDDITEWLYFILHRQKLFPDPECDPARLYDWRAVVYAAEHMTTLQEQAVGIRTAMMPVRRPGKPAVRHYVSSYDAQILAPMLYFYEFARILRCEPYAPAYYRPDTTEEIMEPPVEHATETMKRVTAHLMPEASSTQPQLTVPLTMPGSAAGSKGPSTPSQVDPGSKATTTSASSVDDSSMDVDGQDAQASAPAQQTIEAQNTIDAQKPLEAQKPLDIFYEASKTPLDAALFNSIRIAGEDRISKYLTSVLITGGPTRISYMAQALMSRLQSAARAVMQDDTLRASTVQMGNDVDRTALVWKGAAVLGKMEGVSELWVTPADWDLLGMRGLKERCFYL